MTDEPRSLGQSLDAELFADYPPPVVIANPDNATDADVSKATVILRVLSDAGLRPPFDFHPDDAKRLWGITLSPFSLEVLIEAVGDFIRAPDRNYPTLGEVEAAARFTEREIQQEERAEDARTVGPCTECDDVHWVRVEDPNGPGQFMRPCSQCPGMAHRYELYQRGHFDGSHVDAGGCPACWEYMKPYSARTRARAQAST